MRMSYRTWSNPALLNNLPLECERAIKHKVINVESARQYINNLEPRDDRNAEENPMFNQPFILVWSKRQNKPVVSFNVHEHYEGPSNRTKFQMYLDSICKKAYKNKN